jgi:hypothetical protein
MTLVTYRNEENRTNRVDSLLLARNSFDPFLTLHGIVQFAKTALLLKSLTELLQKDSQMHSEMF